MTNNNEFKITNVSISSLSENCCLCIDIDEQTSQLICKRLGVEISKGGEGCDGFINIQYPISNDSQTYIAGSNWDEDIDGYFQDEFIQDLVGIIIYEASDLVSKRDFELERLFGTSNIETHDNDVLHGYYNGLSLALLVNLDTNEVYVTFESLTNYNKEYFPVGFKTFDNIDKARDYIQSHCDNFQSLQDFGISHAIYNEIDPIEQY